MRTKKCSSCKIEKAPSEFYKRNASKDGLAYRCKECDKRFSKEWVLTHKEQRKESDKKWVAKNKEKVKQIKKDFYVRHPDYLEKQRLKSKEQGQPVRQKLSEEDRKLHRKLAKKKYLNTHPRAILLERIRTRLRMALTHNYKSQATKSLLGCSIEQLKEHLESQFIEGMTWDNYGQYGWHIDHVKALIDFDLTNPEQLKQACHYTNLQPLWAKDNYAKERNRRKKKEEEHELAEEVVL